AGTFSKSKVTTSTSPASAPSAAASSNAALTSGAHSPAQASAAGSCTLNCSPSGRPASAIIRASCPPPRIPTRWRRLMRGDSLPRIVIGHDVLGLALAEDLQRAADVRVLGGQHGGGEQPGIGGAG